MTKVFEALERARKDAANPQRDTKIPHMVMPQNATSGNGEIEMEREMLSLYHAIVASLPDLDRRVILLVASHSDEGTSTVARQLARTVSLRLEKAVLLIDLDRSRPDLHVYGGAQTNSETDETEDPIDETLCQAEEGNLYVMPLFQRTLATPRTLDRAREGTFWEPLRQRFDLIIVDSPPATVFPDGPGLVSRVDGVILVVEAEKTRWQVAMTVKEKVIKSGGNLLGIVFNKRRYHIPAWLYRYF